MTTAEISDKLVSWGSIKKPMSMSRLGMVLQQAGFQSKRIGKARTRGHPFLKITHMRVCVRFINKGVRRSTRPPKNFVHCVGMLSDIPPITA